MFGLAKVAVTAMPATVMRAFNVDVVVKLPLSRRSIRIVPVRAIPIAVAVVAAAAAVVGPRRSGADRSGANRGHTDTVAVVAIGPVAAVASSHAPAAYSDSAAPLSPSCDRGAAVASRSHGTAAVETSGAHTAAAAAAC
jgi:hypothetical protein